MSMTFNCANGKGIITKDGRKLGPLSGVEVDTDTWTVIKVQAQVSKEVGLELGKKKPFLRPCTVWIKKDVVGAVGDVVSLKVEMKELRQFLS